MGPFSNADLKLAFSLHIADLIIKTDNRMDEGEAAFMERTFPAVRLREAGFLDAEGERTEAYDEAAMAALDVLPSVLSETEKRELLAVFVEAVRADGEVSPNEARALVDGGRLLEMSDSLLAALLLAELGVDLSSLAEEESEPE